MLQPYSIRLGINQTDALKPTTGLPNMTTVRDGQGNAGFATTYQDGSIACLGELIERKHFFHEVPVHRMGELPQCCSESFCRSFAKMAQQTANSGGLYQTSGTYVFELTSCLNLSTWQPAYIPTVLISLGKSKDSAWIAVRDTSGCASHSDPEKTLEAAMMEFLERQNLTSCWIAEQCRYQINLDEFVFYLPSDLQQLINCFMEAGSLYIVNSSLLFNCYSIMAIFIAHSDSQHVKFSLGSACCLSPFSAIKKALYELWQSFSLMSETHNRVESTAYQLNRAKYGKLIRNFCDANQRETLQEFPYLARHAGPKLSLPDYLSQPTLTLTSILQELRTISDNVFYYSVMFPLADQACFVGRVVSPDFFVSMDNQVTSFNLINAFSDRLAIQLNKKKPLPFA